MARRSGSVVILVGAAVLCAGPSFGAADPVWITPVSARAGERQALEELARLRDAYAAARAQWESLRYAKISYTVVEDQSGSLIRTACAEWPLHVTTYPDGRSDFRVGVLEPPVPEARKVKESDCTDRLFTPKALFHAVEREIGSSRETMDCVKAEFDAATGLPRRLAFGCPWISDGSWSLQLTNISIFR